MVVPPQVCMTNRLLNVFLLLIISPFIEVTEYNDLFVFYGYRCFSCISFSMT